MADRMEVQHMTVNGEPHVKVRIPISVTANGQWLAHGVWHRARKDAVECVESLAKEALGDASTIRTSFIYAVVPLTDDIAWGDVEGE